MRRRSKRRRKDAPPQEGVPYETRYWIYVWDGIDSGIRVGWSTSKDRAIAWLRNHAPGGWAFDTRARVRYTRRGRVA
jgi:hypothetical protein